MARKTVTISRAKWQSIGKKPATGRAIACSPRGESHDNRGASKYTRITSRPKGLDGAPENPVKFKTASSGSQK